MTRKDYEKFATVIAASKKRFQGMGNEAEIIGYFQLEIADIFAADSLHFSRARFLNACEVKPEYKVKPSEWLGR